jgi:hypothetical protein
VSVLLIEKQVNLGGLATQGLISWYEPLCDGEGTQMIYGIAEELIRLSVRYGLNNLPTRWGGKNEADGRFATHFSPTIFTMALDEYVMENGVKLRFDTYATYPVMTGNHCDGVICESVNGREFFGANVVIDATGDATVCHRAGMPTEVGENYMTYVAHCVDADSIAQYQNSGQMAKLRRWVNPGSDLFGNGHPEGMRKLKGDTAEDITDYVIYGKQALLKRVKEKDNESFDVMTLPSMPQFRTIRRIIGAQDFNAVDGETFDNSIGNCGDFRPFGKGKHYQIPYGALYNSAFDNLLACGRIISAPAGDGWEVARVIPTCALTGEAAGKAAAVAVKEFVAVKDAYRS